MDKKERKKKKTTMIYYEAPEKSAASYFFASFFITVAFLMSVAGIYVVNKNSKQVGFGEDVQVLSIVKTAKQYDITVAGKTFSVDRKCGDGLINLLGCINCGRIKNEPEPFYFIDAASGQIADLEFKILSKYDPVRRLFY